MKPEMRLGVDTGGTFTDFVWLDGDGRIQIHKQLSTPDDPARAILAGVREMAVPETAAIVHGSTVATNALLERRGARTALITTAGFGDVLAISRQNRPDIYALVPQKPPPLVPRQWRFEVEERVTAAGDVLIPLDEASLEAILLRLAEEKIESAAVCLLYSFLYPDHERQIGAAIRQIFGEELPVSLSCDILPEYREYERTSTTVINAYVAPLMGRYLTRLAAEVQPRPLTIMQSNGGIISAETAGREAARTALSGPAGGVVGARYVAAQAGFERIITFDMGGTSTDVALCDGRLPTTTQGEIAGMPLRLPLIDIHTVGAGGGSLAWVDPGGALHAGPQSAGAHPGPACYGLEKSPISNPSTLLRTSLQSPIPNLQSPISRATVTDANLLLGRLDADHFLGGAMRLDVAAARAALAELAGQMGADSPETAAWGVIQVANANMERAIRRISVERGYDPRRFTLVPFGGAGPLHACELAQNLQIPRVLIPSSPGVLSALGMLTAAPAKDYSRTVMLPAAAAGALPGQFAPLRERAQAEMAQEGHAEVTLHYHLDVRYRGQSHELTIPYTPGEGVTAVTQTFHAAHQTRYGYRQPQEPVEIVTIRLTAVAPVPPPVLPIQPLTQTSAVEAIIGEKEVRFDQRSVVTTLYQRERLRPGHHFSGPALVFQYDTTIVIPPGWVTAVDETGNLVVSRKDRNGNTDGTD
ncbi:MAG TPA: hydantoinase/oxoprolinase family protein [Anaerolineae bacterium]|nr:hydantoinase/oxoprolinase family protein [Anaerolineae bacterium]